MSATVLRSTLSLGDNAAATTSRILPVVSSKDSA